MSELEAMIAVKQMPNPAYFYGSPVFTHPPMWMGDYRVSFPIVDQRRAGIVPTIDSHIAAPESHDDIHRRADMCFEFAPKTTVPCRDSLCDYSRWAR